MAAKGLSTKIVFYFMILSILQLSLDYVEANNLNSTRFPLVVEQVVLLKVKAGLSQSQLTSIYNNVSTLQTINGIKHFSYGPVRRVISPTLNFSNSDIVHIRFGSREAADAYYDDPTHVAVMNAVVPLLDDIMVVSWVARPSPPRPVSLPAGSPVKVQLLKLKGGENETHCSFNNDRAIIAKIVNGENGKVWGLKQLTFGENIAPANYSKAYSFGILGVFSRLNELDNVKGFIDGGKCIEEFVIVDFVTMLVNVHQSASPPAAV